MTEVEAFKLNSSEEIIGRVIEKPGMDTNSYWVLSHVRTIMPHQQGLAMIPHMMTCKDGNIYVYKSNIASRAETISEQLVKVYLEQTSGIVLASG